MKRWVLGVVFGLLLAVLLLAAFFPASWAWRMAAPRLHGVQVRAVHGSVWNGRAEGVAYAGMPVGTVRWTLSRLSLVGRPDLHLAVNGPLLRGRAQLSRHGDMLLGEDVHATLDVARLPVSFGPDHLLPRGEMVLDLPRLVIRDDWPSELRGHLDWRGAALADGARTIALGDLHAELRERAGALLQARLSDGGGPLSLSGTAQASTLGWRLDADLKPRGGDPALRRVLAQLGAPDADGSLHLRRYGGLMMGEEP